ncbi:MAG: HAD family hydrolase [Deltaproteobacteria bacterium]|nr:HAD family hydrolase [Deltaproteobacteria bacterium]
MAIKGLVFDFDGTLTRPGSIDFAGIKRALACPPEKAILEFLDTLDPDRLPQALETVEKFEMEAAEKSSPNDGVADLLNWILRRGLPWGILTRNGRPSLNVALTKFSPSVRDQAAFILTRDDVAPKPNPAGVLAAARLLQVSSTEIMVVGDYRFDILAGQKADAVTVLLTHGRPPPMRPEDQPPDYTVATLADLRVLLDNLLSGRTG